MCTAAVQLLFNEVRNRGFTGSRQTREPHDHGFVAIAMDAGDLVHGEALAVHVGRAAQAE
jgi:hypothetical protein